MSKKSGLLLESDGGGVNQILPHKHKFAWDLFQRPKAGGVGGGRGEYPPLNDFGYSF